MSASIKHIQTNVERMATDAELLALWNAEATDDRTPGQAWTAFVATADKARIADRIPGTVGRTFKAKYAASPQPNPVAAATKRSVAKKATIRKASNKVSGK